MARKPIENQQKRPAGCIEVSAVSSFTTARASRASSSASPYSGSSKMALAWGVRKAPK